MCKDLNWVVLQSSHLPGCVLLWTPAWSTWSPRRPCSTRSKFFDWTQRTEWSGLESSRRPDWQYDKKCWNMLMLSKKTPTFQSLVWMQQRYCIPSPPSEGFSKPAASTWVWWTLNILSFEASRINIKIDVQADRKDLFVLKERGHDQNCVNTRRTWRYWDF